MSCQVCLSTLKAGDLYCSSCGAVVPEHPPKPAELRGRIAGERKYLTVLCADLQRSTDLISELDPEAAISRLEPALIAMRTAVRRNRGIVSKEGGDGLIALFGAPHADDNHAVMACHAAVELVRRVKLLDDPALQVRVGVHSGYVVAHVIKADFSSIYEAGGPAVHLVKRLESAAQAGQIMVSESCQSLAAGLVTFHALPPKQLEGFSAPVPCYELAEISGLTRWRARSTKGLSSFVGREEETSLLDRAARETGPSGQIIALVGTAGIGKSRMAHEFVSVLRERDWQVLEAEGNPLEQAVPYALLKKLLQSALQVGNLTPANLAAFAEGQGLAHSDLWPAALGSVLDQPITDPRWHDLEPLLRRRAIIDSARHAIEQVVSARPTILLLEDLHWIDGQSETAIEAMMSLTANHPLLVLLTWRTEDTPGWLARLDVRRIWLRSLDVPSANALLDDLLGTAEHLDDLKAHILRHTGQVPLFIEEVARQLINRGVLKADPAGFATKVDWDALEIPPTVQGVIASRIDRMPNEDKALLQLASVVGPRISHRLLATVIGMPAAQLQSRLWSLEILDFLVEPRSITDPEHEFSHDLIREVAYDSILRTQREELHRRILTALEVNSAGHEADVAEALCHHAVKAHDWAKASHYGRLAARKALARSAFRDAAGYFQTAIDAVDRLPDSVEREQRAIDLRIEARLALAPLGSIEQWFGLCRDAEARSEKIGDEQRRLASIVAKAVALNFYGAPFDAITASEQAVALANTLAATAWLGYAEYVLGQAYFIAGRYRDAERLFDQASARLASAPENAPPGTTGASLLVLCHMMKALVYVSLGEYDDSERCSRQASDLAESNDRPYDIVAALYGRGLVQMSHGDFDGAERALDEAAFLSRENEVRLFLPLVLCALGNLNLQKGRAAEARDILLKAKEEAEALGHASSTMLAPVYLASAFAQLGDIPRGLEVARACQAGAKQKGYLGIEALAAFAEGFILSLQGAPSAAEAKARLDRTIELATTLGARPLLGMAKGALARLLAASGRKSEAQDELAQAIELFDKSKMTVQLERAKVTLSKFADL
ncbi:AAA family ATPase [Bradyrhizobium sediminis]|uniref:AAA family ATPase n=1 Tax=Bradyrhizobium sediminis TaxID=2840469 RepID=A0A975NHC5_9BRAD|nr:AAA family ATPase [Bradyrhizobium sediminis]QWG14840.1 AAA family ATPase [Bradyrhizobium sediminis]